MLIYGILGFRFKETFELNPVYQTHIDKIETSIHYQNSKIHIKLEKNILTLKVNQPIEMSIHGETIHVDSYLDYKIQQNPA
jgi:alpha,alpha-trehalose phosphorylase